MNQVINEAYENYISVKEDYHKRLINNSVSDIQPLELLPMDKFIDKIKIDSDFSDRWKLKITERELSLEERDKLAVGTVTFLLGSKKKDSYDEVGIPTKLIIITYNNKIIESYE
jgi:hypothetical protein